VTVNCVPARIAIGMGFSENLVVIVIVISSDAEAPDVPSPIAGYKQIAQIIIAAAMTTAFSIPRLEKIVFICHVSPFTTFCCLSN